MKKRRSHDRDIMQKCDVCGKIVLVNDYGHGKCEHCGWENSGSLISEEKNCGYPNLVSLKRAKELFKQGKPFLPNFDDFINNFKFYGEMEFVYSNKTYYCYFYDKEKKFGLFDEINVLGLFSTIDEFAEKAKINEKLLKEIWSEIEDANFSF